MLEKRVINMEREKIRTNFVVLVWNWTYQCDAWFSVYIKRYRNIYIVISSVCCDHLATATIQ